MLGCKPANTPLEPNTHLKGQEGDPVDKGSYQRLVGRLIYLSHTRPDITFAVSMVSHQFLATPKITHWYAVIRILRYLKGNPGRGLVYRDYGHRRVEGFFYADWARFPADRRSTTGYCVFVGGNLVSLKSKKQPVVARSSAESEYRAMTHTICELMWVRQLLTEMGFADASPMQLRCDNQAAIHIASNSVFHERTKHIEVDCHFVREKIQQGLISTCHVKTRELLADIFTKSHENERMQYLCNKLGMIDIYTPTRGRVLEGLCLYY
ncbi:hypothetical protein CFOL_v3_15072 [Cephalotus follicularis]|uniref:RVT_2 domain-containing protein n=1 Tax=Cephalotus follicularis TaxID=3775 RepID=A0A1Q3BUL9_CEPFO|nr:hypothetical protein CFOL_v3_15072 [Cephalotus follicularis]